MQWTVFSFVWLSFCIATVAVVGVVGCVYAIWNVSVSFQALLIVRSVRFVGHKRSVIVSNHVLFCVCLWLLLLCFAVHLLIEWYMNYLDFLSPMCMVAFYGDGGGGDYGNVLVISMLRYE